MNNYLFDFDFTLADSSTGIIKSINYAFTKLNLGSPSDIAIKKTIGLSLIETYRHLAGKNNHYEEEMFQKYFKEKANEVMVESTELFPNVHDCIKKMSVSGSILGIISTKYRYRIVDVLNQYDLTSNFQIIIGGEDVNNHKPDPEGLLIAIKKLNLCHDNLFYVGDSIVDAKTAHNGDVSFIASLTGVTMRNEFAEYPVHTFINDISELC